MDVNIAANVWIDDLYVQDATNGIVTVERTARFVTAQVFAFLPITSIKYQHIIEY